MPAQSKIDMVERICESIKGSKGVYVIDYQGLTVKEAQELRRNLREAGATMKVYKNNLVKLALQQCDQPALDDILVGTNAYVFYEDDPATAAKAIKTEGKKLDKLSFKGGIADGKAITAEDAMAYADLPSREQLVAQLVFTIASPLSGIASVCAGPARGLVTALDAVAGQKDAA
jgi:large subunit ribosomal protein L10